MERRRIFAAVALAPVGVVLACATAVPTSAVQPPTTSSGIAPASVVVTKSDSLPLPAPVVPAADGGR